MVQETHSLVIFPFKSEDVEIIERNVKRALSHPAVASVYCVGYEENECYRQMENTIGEIQNAFANKTVRLGIQERFGTKRPGKGDGMNTGLQYFLNETDLERLHFYDSDIKTFTKDWITDAEQGADWGYDVVRHYFSRSPTDAMITWMITKTGFALLWPHTELPYIEQPLGGELLMTRGVAEELANDDRVLAQSDWGIDTIYTWTMVKHGFSLYEAYQKAGKVHSLYQTLADLKSMLVECFAAIQSLSTLSLETRHLDHRMDKAAPAPETVKTKVGYDVEGTIHLLSQNWTEKQEEILDLFPRQVSSPMLENRERPRFNFMDADNWFRVYEVLLENFDLDSEAWKELLFKLWVTRVLNYTSHEALKGYDHTMHYLYQMIERFTRRQL